MMDKFLWQAKVIQMAKDAGIERRGPGVGVEEYWTCSEVELQKLASMAYAVGAAAEREKHEQRIDTIYRLYEQASEQRDQLMAAQVDAIRARVQQ
jgi:hypothetical protein